jgi:hypothetical protein
MPNPWGDGSYRTTNVDVDDAALITVHLDIDTSSPGCDTSGGS